MVTAESPASRVGHITLGRKRAGKPIAGNRHDGFEVAGTGTQLTVWLVRHSQRKRGAMDRLNLRSMAPVLDPTLLVILRTNWQRFVNNEFGELQGWEARKLQPKEMCFFLTSTFIELSPSSLHRGLMARLISN